MKEHFLFFSLQIVDYLLENCLSFASLNDSYGAFDFASTYANKMGAILLYGYVGTDNGNVWGRPAAVF